MNLPDETVTFTLQCVVNLKTMPSTFLPLGGYCAPYLWVRPTDQAVGIGERSGDWRTGHRWRADHRSDGTVWLSVNNTKGGPGARCYLQRRGSGVIGVTADTSLPDIAWKVVEAPNSLALECVATITDVELLCGEIATGFVGTQSTQYARRGSVEKTGQSTAWQVDNKQYSGGDG